MFHTMTFERGYNSPINNTPGALAKFYDERGLHARALVHAENAAFDGDMDAANFAGCLHHDMKHPTLSFFFLDMAARAHHSDGFNNACKQLTDDLQHLIKPKHITALYAANIYVKDPFAAFRLAEASEKAFNSSDGKIFLLYADALTHPEAEKAKQARNKVCHMLSTLEDPRFGPVGNVYEAFPDKTRLPTRAVAQIRQLLSLTPSR